VTRHDNDSTVGIVGLGYVGLPLAVAFAEAGLDVRTKASRRCRSTATTVAAADCVVIATAHSSLDLGLVVEHADLVVDLRNAVRRRLSGSTSGPVPSNVDVL
jgi:UDP-N-acetyl-D-mannosaminuronate dehydrogenase